MRGKAMAKKRRDRDFRPDKPQGSLLDKLYITKQQRETLLKWTLYGVLTLLCLVIQDTFLSGIWVFGASPDLVPMIILLIGMMQSTEAGATFALCAALFYFHAGSAPGAFCRGCAAAAGICPVLPSGRAICGKASEPRCFPQLRL